MKKVNVIIELKNGEVLQREYPEDVWFGIVYETLENSDNVVHYTAQTIK